MARSIVVVNGIAHLTDYRRKDKYSDQVAQYLEQIPAITKHTG